MTMRLAVIPARGGSKRIPRKNIREFAGKPMLAHSIEAARESGCFTHVIVSTDDPEIADVACAHGADVPFIRPADLSDDLTATTPVVAHAIEWYQARGETLSHVCCIYATAPFLDVSDLQRGFELIDTDAYDYVFSATRYAFPIQRALRLDREDCVGMFQPAHFLTRSQDLEEAFHDAGQFYWGKPSAWLVGKPAFSGTSRAILLPRHRVQDIDTLDDWTRAEWMWQVMALQRMVKS